MSTYSRAAVARSLTSNAGARHRLPGVFTFKNISVRNSSSSSPVDISGKSSSPSPIGGVVIDQTKKGNDPNQEKREEHVEAGNKATSAEGRDHPAKQAGPEKAPERSTGFETQGPDGNAGEGKADHVHKQEKPPLTK